MITDVNYFENGSTSTFMSNFVVITFFHIEGQLSKKKKKLSFGVKVDIFGGTVKVARILRFHCFTGHSHARVRQNLCDTVFLEASIHN
jgi:hypothetical protein